MCVWSTQSWFLNPTFLIPQMSVMGVPFIKQQQLISSLIRQCFDWDGRMQCHSVLDFQSISKIKQYFYWDLHSLGFHVRDIIKLFGVTWGFNCQDQLDQWFHEVVIFEHSWTSQGPKRTMKCLINFQRIIILRIIQCIIHVKIVYS